MASYTEKRLIHGTLLTTTVATLYTCSSPVVKTIVKEIAVCNTTDIAYTFTLYIIANGQVATDRYAIFKTVTMQPNETKIFGLSSVLGVGDFIAAIASTANVLSISASGVERT